MARFSVMDTAMTAAVPCTADSSSCAGMSRAASSCANTMHIALILDAILMASIFVVLLGLSLIRVMSLISLISLLILCLSAYRLKDPRPTFV